jgi:aspartate aminotransferase
MFVFRPSRAADRVARTSRRAVPVVPAQPSASASQIDVVSLALGEPDFPTPAPILEAMTEALRAGFTRYAEFDGDRELRAAIAERVQTARGPESVLITQGSMAGLSAAVLATVGIGDKVVIPEPTYSLYSDLVELAGATPVFVGARSDYHLDLDALAEAARGARLIILCNPCNPTGAVCSRAELETLAEIIARTDALLLVDEAYAALVYDGIELVSSTTVPALADRLIYVQTFSKTFAMTGFRVGYVVSRPEIVSAIASVHRTFNGPVNAAVQRAALRAVRDDGTMVRPMLEAYARRRSLLLRLLEGAPRLEVRPPEGTFFAFVRLLCDITSVDLAARLRRGGVTVRAGSEFGPSGEHHVRLSFAPGEAIIEEGVRRMRAVLADL